MKKKIQFIDAALIILALVVMFAVPQGASDAADCGIDVVGANSASVVAGGDPVTMTVSTDCPDGNVFASGWDSPAPIGVSVSFNPGSCSNPCSSTMTIGASASASIGSYTLALGRVPIGQDTRVRVTVDVISPAPPTVGISANNQNPVTIPYNNYVTLRWDVLDSGGGYITDCIASGGWGGSKSISGSLSTGNLTQDTTYYLTCTNSLGLQGQAGVTVYVTPLSCTVPVWNPNTSGYFSNGGAKISSVCNATSYKVRCDFGRQTDNIEAPEGCTWGRWVNTTAAEFDCAGRRPGTTVQDSCVIGSGGSGNICSAETQSLGNLSVSNCGCTGTENDWDTADGGWYDKDGAANACTCDIWDACGYNADIFGPPQPDSCSPDTTHTQCTASCGGSSEACCSGDLCDEGLYCSSGTCVPIPAGSETCTYDSCTAADAGQTVCVSSSQTKTCLWQDSNPSDGVGDYCWQSPVSCTGGTTCSNGVCVPPAPTPGAIRITQYEAPDATPYPAPPPLAIGIDAASPTIPNANPKLYSSLSPGSHSIAISSVPAETVLEYCIATAGYTGWDKCIRGDDRTVVSSDNIIWVNVSSGITAYVYIYLTPQAPAGKSGATCNTSYPSDQFQVCYYQYNPADGVPPSRGTASVQDKNLLYQTNEPVLAPSSSGIYSANNPALSHSWSASDKISNTGRINYVKAAWRTLVNFAAGTYIFHAITNDGISLMEIDGGLGIALLKYPSTNSWINQSSVEYTSDPIKFESQGTHKLRLKWYDYKGSATVKFWWDYIPDPAPDATCPAGQDFGNAQYIGVNPKNKPVVETSLFDGDQLVIVAVDASSYVRVYEWKNGWKAGWYGVWNGQAQGRPKLAKVNGSLYLYIRGLDGTIYRSKYLAQGSWENWVSTGVVNANFGATGPDSVSTSYGTFKVAGNSVVAVNIKRCTASPALTCASASQYPANKFNACYGSSVYPSNNYTLPPTEPADTGMSIIAQANDSATALNPANISGTNKAVNRSWGTGFIDSTTNIDDISAVYTSTIDFQQGEYVFHVKSDDGAKLFIDTDGNGSLDPINFITPSNDSWKQQGATQYDTEPISFASAGSKKVLLKWFERGGGASLQFWWDSVPEPVADASCPADQSFAEVVPFGAAKNTTLSPAIQYHSGDNRIFVIIREDVTNNVLAQELAQNGTILKPWYQIQGGQTNAAPKLWTASDGKLYVYIKGLDGYIHRSRWDNAGLDGWSIWMATGVPNSSFGSSGPHAVSVWGTAYKVTNTYPLAQNTAKLGKCATRPVVTVVSPKGGATVDGGLSGGHVSIPLDWTFSDTLGGSQDRYRVELIEKSCGSFNRTCFDGVDDFKYSGGTGPNNSYFDLPEGANTLRIANLLPSKTYIWRVRARSAISDIDGASRYSETTPDEEFTTGSGITTAEIRVKRVGSDDTPATAPSGTAAWTSIDAPIKKTANPAFFEDSVPGSRTVYASHVSGFKAAVGVCTYLLANESDCTVSFGSPADCPSTGCVQSITTAPGLVTKVVFKYSSGGLVTSLPACNNTLDDDNDNLVDFGSGITNDPGCSGLNDINESDDPPVPACRDGRDNDGDGHWDFGSGANNDPGCSSSEDNDEYGTAQCDNGNDDDGIQGVDMDDPDCMSLIDDNESAAPACDDGSDNDGDTFEDYPDDPGCSSSSDISELGAKQCDNGADDDVDTATDYPADISCETPLDDDESNTPQCNNSVDDPDPEDVLVDLSDYGCFDNRDNDERDGGLPPDGVKNFIITHTPRGGEHPHDEADILIKKSPIPTYTTLTISVQGISSVDLEVVSLRKTEGPPPIDKDKLYYFFDGVRDDNISVIGIGSQKQIRFHVEKRDIPNGFYIITLIGSAGDIIKDYEIILEIGDIDPGYKER